MSTVYATESFGMGMNGGTVWVEAGGEYSTDDAVVKAQPEMFTAQAPEDEEQPKRRGRRG